MKKIAILTLMLILLATPALAMLKVLDAAVAQELEGIAKKNAAAEHKVELSKIAIQDPWLRELYNIKLEVYVVPMVVNGAEVTVYVQVDTKEVLSDAAMKALVAENLAKEPSEPVFRTMSLATDTEAVEDTNQENLNYLPYVAGIVGLVTIGAGAVIFRARM